MRAAGLHAIHTILSSQAVLIHSSRPSPEHSALIQKITARIAGVIAAKKYVLCNYNVPRKSLEACTAITPGRRAATVSPLDDKEWVAVSAMVEKASLADTMDKLGERGATDILVIGIVSYPVTFATKLADIWNRSIGQLPSLVETSLQADPKTHFLRELYLIEHSSLYRN